MHQHLEALLLLGPTGSGKTPLGAMCERRGWQGRRCVHFDFGENLRLAVARDTPDEIVSAADIRFLREVLARGVLLEDKDFPLAARILRSHLRRAGATAETLVVLNGLPRHAGQAAAVAELLDVRTVVCLECSPEVVLTRVAANTGGDRAQRTDDDLAAVQRKLAIYAERTAPLVDYYRRAGARLIQLKVTNTMTSAQMWEQLEQATKFAS